MHRSFGSNGGMKQPLTAEEFRDIYSKVPRLNVEVCIKTERGLVLTKRSIEPWKNYWHIPGGTVYMGETLDDAVRRVALYETGVKVAVGKLLGAIVYPGIHGQNSFGWPIGIAFLASIASGRLQGSDMGEEIVEFAQLPENIISEQKTFINEHRLL